MQDTKSFMGYKRDQRGTLEVSPMGNEKYVEQQKTKYEDLKTNLKYRLYGLDGLSSYEIRKLVKEGQIKVKIPGKPLPENDKELRDAIVKPKADDGFKV